MLSGDNSDSSLINFVLPTKALQLETVIAAVLNSRTPDQAPFPVADRFVKVLCSKQLCSRDPTKFLFHART